MPDIAWETLEAPLTPRRRAELAALARALRRQTTPAEDALWRVLRRRRPDGVRFRRQHRVGPFIADFFSFEAALVVEVDGPVHLRQLDKDAARDQLLLAAGIRTLRVTNDAVLTDLDAVLKTIRRAVTPPATPPAP